MPLVYSAIMPHSPALLPGLSSSGLLSLTNTTNACHKIADNLLKRQVETILVISPHGLLLATEFSANIEDNFTAEFAEFGDLVTKLNISGDIGLLDDLSDYIAQNYHFRLVSSSELDYGTALPLTYLSEEALRGLSLSPLYCSDLPLADHWQFGKLVAEYLKNTTQRVAVIASGDLSHRLSKLSPAGYSAKAKWFDKRVIKAVETGQTKEIFKLDKDLLDEVKECGLKPITLLMGIMSESKMQPQIISYDHPVGVGWLVAEYL